MASKIEAKVSTLVGPAEAAAQAAERMSQAGCWGRHTRTHQSAIALLLRTLVLNHVFRKLGDIKGTCDYHKW